VVWKWLLVVGGGVGWVGRRWVVRWLGGVCGACVGGWEGLGCLGLFPAPEWFKKDKRISTLRGGGGDRSALLETGKAGTLL